LCAASFADVVFFANSGAEAMECAIKMARKYQSTSGRPERYRIITYDGAFHGRTLATLAAGGQKKYLDGFGPVVDGFDQVPFADLEATRRAIGPATAAILIEPIMGEGGVRVVAPEFLRMLRKLCDDNGLLLVFDEVQTGIGRTGRLFAYERCGVTPDIMGLAKALGGGFPLGACLATAEAAKGMTVGTHGSTFGGNPLAMAVGSAVLDVVLADGFLERVRRIALLLKQKLAEIKDRYPAVIAELRGEGLLLGLRTVVPNGDLVDELRAEKLIAVAAGDNVVRLLPPLIVSEAEVAEAVSRLERACARLDAAAARPRKLGSAG
jgi:acetylornithine/N-succinyldiaminopimelate aminotransferase